MKHLTKFIVIIFKNSAFLKIQLLDGILKWSYTVRHLTPNTLQFVIMIWSWFVARFST